MANNSHPIFYFPFYSFVSSGVITLSIIVSTNQIKHYRTEKSARILLSYWCEPDFKGLK